MGCACFKQDVVVSKIIKISKTDNNQDENKNIDIKIRIVQNEERDKTDLQVHNCRSDNQNSNNNLQSIGLSNERVNQNINNIIIPNHNRSIENIHNFMTNEPYLQSKNSSNFNMPVVGKKKSFRK